MTANDYALGVYNGETGVVVRQGARPRAFVAGCERLARLRPGRLGDVETMHAMTIHKCQGSQAERVTVLLPDEDSRLLTRELFYTAVTRARSTCAWSAPRPPSAPRSPRERSARPGCGSAGL